MFPERLLYLNSSILLELDALSSFFTFSSDKVLLGIARLVTLLCCPVMGFTASRGLQKQAKR